MEIIKEEKEEIEQENLRLRKQTEDNDDEMGNICNPYYKL